MTASAQMSIYPLRQDRLGSAIDAVREAFEARGLKPQVGPMSTIVSGQCDLIFAALHEAFASAAAKDLATRHGANLGYVIGRAEQLPFANDSFDVLTAMTILCFVSEPSRALREMARVLKPCGRVVIGDLGKWSLWAVSRRIRGWLDSAIWRAARFRTARELCALAEQAKLRVEMTRGAVYYPPVEFLARLMAPADPLLGRLTAMGAAFLTMRATKASDK